MARANHYHAAQTTGGHMSYYGYGQQSVAAAQADAVARSEFIRKTYLHLGVAIVAFTALTGALLRTSVPESMIRAMAGSRFGWLLFLAGFMVVGHVANRWADSGRSTPMQYLGLGLYVVAEAILIAPMMWIAANVPQFANQNVLATAGILTLTTFGGLTATVFITKKDFGFLGKALMIAMFAAMGLIIVSMIFGFSLGALFSGAMVVLAAGYVLYYTSNVLHRYPTDAHVAASLALFASIALLFWYILRLVMDLTGRR
jgi:FtsH-binding integral membrane protein